MNIGIIYLQIPSSRPSIENDMKIIQYIYTNTIGASLRQPLEVLPLKGIENTLVIKTAFIYPFCQNMREYGPLRNLQSTV